MVGQIDPFYFRTRPYKAAVRLLSHALFQGRFVTTDHRWLNTAILAHLRFASRLPILKTVEKPILIVGTGRSGSTILGKVLSMQRDIAFLNEPKALWYIINSWDDVNGHFGVSPAKYRFGSDEVTAAQRIVAQRLYSYYLLLTASSRVLDKNPEIIFRAAFVQALFPDAKFIFLVRNGWDTIRSIKVWSEGAARMTNGIRQDWWGTDRRKWRIMKHELVTTEPLLAPHLEEIEQLENEEQMAAVEWIVTMQEGLRLLQSMPDSVYKLHYEALTQCPEQSLRALLDFCELPPDRVFLNYGQEILEPNLAKKPLVLPPFLDKPFRATMTALGYRSQVSKI